MHTFLDKQSADNDDLELEFGIPSAAGLTNGSAAKKVKKSPSEAALLKMGRRDSPTGLCEKNAEISYDWVSICLSWFGIERAQNSSLRMFFAHGLV